MEEKLIFQYLLGNSHFSFSRAAFGGYKECVRLLIQKGANLAQVTNNGETTIDTIFRNILKPEEFLNEIFNSQIQTNGSDKCNTDFCVNVGKFFSSSNNTDLLT